MFVNCVLSFVEVANIPVCECNTHLISLQSDASLDMRLTSMDDSYWRRVTPTNR